MTADFTVENKKPENKEKFKKSVTVPRFKSKIIKPMKDAKETFPIVNSSVFKYYDLDKSSNVINKKPFIVYLDQDEVDKASTKEKTEFIKSVGGLSLKIISGALLLIFLVFAILGITSFLKK